MPNISRQRCFNHELREAVARCPECGRYFCRECITDHEDRVLCTSCLSKLLSSEPLSRFPFQWVFRSVQFLIGFLVLWLFFYYLGQALISLPSSFHEGTIWTI